MALDVNSLINWDDAADEVEAVLRGPHAQLLELAFADASDLLEVGISFDLSNPKVKETIKDLAKQVRDVAETTKEEVRALIARQTEEGWSTEQLAQEIRKLGGLDGDDVSKARSRAKTIARTETTTAYNQGAILAYDEAGVKKVEALDSDNDPECAERNGKIYTLAEAAAIKPHPNCTLAWAPVVD